MSYPFENSPFEEYFLKLRDFRLDEIEAYLNLNDTRISRDIRSAWTEKYNQALSNIKKTISKNQIPPRGYDVYLGEIDLALEKFKQEFPMPDKPGVCEHGKMELRLKKHADDTTHVVTQCIICGRMIDNYKKSDIVNWKTLPPFEENIKRKEEIEYQIWWTKRNEILKNAIGDDGQYPDFDYEAFYESYKKENPAPKSPSECQHLLPQLTIRKYSQPNISVVLQCSECGKHIKSVSKKDVSNISVLPAFNPNIEEQSWDRISQWHEERSAAAKRAQDQFYEDLTRKIESGQISRVDKTTFGSYYDSVEWSRTRERIFERDDSKCQACGKTAECVHHLTYDRLGRENDLDLISLCNTCHDKVHKIQRSKWFGYRLTPKEIYKLNRETR